MQTMNLQKLEFSILQNQLPTAFKQTRKRSLGSTTLSSLTQGKCFKITLCSIFFSVSCSSSSSFSILLAALSRISLIFFSSWIRFTCEYLSHFQLLAQKRDFSLSLLKTSRQQQLANLTSGQRWNFETVFSLLKKISSKTDIMPSWMQLSLKISMLMSYISLFSQQLDCSSDSFNVFLGQVKNGLSSLAIASSSSALGLSLGFTSKHLLRMFTTPSGILDFERLPLLLLKYSTRQISSFSRSQTNLYLSSLSSWWKARSKTSFSPKLTSSYKMQPMLQISAFSSILLRYYGARQALSQLYRHWLGWMLARAQSMIKQEQDFLCSPLNLSITPMQVGHSLPRKIGGLLLWKFKRSSRVCLKKSVRSSPFRSLASLSYFITLNYFTPYLIFSYRVSSKQFIKAQQS